jgi:hypothetical protein
VLAGATTATSSPSNNDDQPFNVTG